MYVSNLVSNHTQACPIQCIKLLITSHVPCIQPHLIVALWMCLPAPRRQKTSEY